jgi:hypothetical protein
MANISWLALLGEHALTTVLGAHAKSAEALPVKDARVPAVCRAFGFDAPGKIMKNPGPPMHPTGADVIVTKRGRGTAVLGVGAPSTRSETVYIMAR